MRKLLAFLASTLIALWLAPSAYAEDCAPITCTTAASRTDCLQKAVGKFADPTYAAQHSCLSITTVPDSGQVCADGQTPSVMIAESGSHPKTLVAASCNSGHIVFKFDTKAVTNTLTATTFLLSIGAILSPTAVSLAATGSDGPLRTSSGTNPPGGGPLVTINNAPAPTPDAGNSGNTPNKPAAGNKDAPPAVKLTQADIPPKICREDTCTPPSPVVNQDPNSHVKIITVGENLAMLGVDDSGKLRNPEFVTESDIVIVRFRVRRLVACRYYATSDASNKYDAPAFRFGGELPPNIVPGGLQLTAGTAPPPNIVSCGYALKPIDQADGFQLADEAKKDEANEYVNVDYRFGPFSNQEIAFGLRRHSHKMDEDDIASTVKVVNHKRYAGWFDITFGVTVNGTGDQVVSAQSENGTALQRINVVKKQGDADVGVMVKAFAKCSDGTSWFGAADIQHSAACVGVGIGLSVAHPLNVFYPVGLNVTFGGALSLHANLALIRGHELAGGLSPGDVYTGSSSSIPTVDRLLAGGNFAVGLDPTLAVTLIKAVVTGK